MIMQDMKNATPKEDSINAWDYVGAVGFALVLFSLIFIATL
jgi:hypothetical protein